MKGITRLTGDSFHDFERGLPVSASSAHEGGAGGDFRSLATFWGVYRSIGCEIGWEAPQTTGAVCFGQVQGGAPEHRLEGNEGDGAASEKSGMEGGACL